jgi:hypothetical protein
MVLQDFTVCTLSIKRPPLVPSDPLAIWHSLTSRAWTAGFHECQDEETNAHAQGESPAGEPDDRDAPYARSKSR